MIKINVSEQYIDNNSRFNTRLDLRRFDRSNIRELVVDEDENYYKVFATILDYHWRELIHVKMKFDKKTGNW